MVHYPLAIDLEGVDAMPFGPGCSRAELPTAGGVRLWVVDMAPGSKWPDIDHHGAYGAAVIVLSGELIEGTSRFSSGSYLVFGPHSRYRPSTESGARLLGVIADPREPRHLSV